MFCPVCRGEYRPEFSRCEQCGVELLESLDPETAEEDLWAAPSVTIWEGMDLAQAEKIKDQVGAAGIPIKVSSSADGGPFQVRVFPATERIAREVLVEPLPPADLSELPGYEERTGECPLCWREVYGGERICWQCLAEIVPPRMSEQSEPLPAANVHHPGDARLIFNKLRREGIPFTVTGLYLERTDVLVPRAPLEPGRYSFYVLEKDLDRAQEAVRRVPLHDVGFEAMPTGNEDVPLEVEAGDRIAVWTGMQREMAEALRYAFRENEIESLLEESPSGNLQLSVRPDHEAPARRIVREVTEGVSLEEVSEQDEGDLADADE